MFCILIAEDNWVLRVTGEAISAPNQPKDRNISVIWYVAAPGEGHTLEVSPEIRNNTESGISAETVYGVRGYGSDVGEYTIVVRDAKGNKHPRIQLPNSNSCVALNVDFRVWVRTALYRVLKCLKCITTYNPWCRGIAMLWWSGLTSKGRRNRKDLPGRESIILIPNRRVLWKAYGQTIFWEQSVIFGNFL